MIIKKKENDLKSKLHHYLLLIQLYKKNISSLLNFKPGNTWQYWIQKIWKYSLLCDYLICSNPGVSILSFDVGVTFTIVVGWAYPNDWVTWNGDVAINGVGILTVALGALKPPGIVELFKSMCSFYKYNK